MKIALQQKNGKTVIVKYKPHMPAILLRLVSIPLLRRQAT